MSPYQQFIHQTRYARWLETEKRRETWEETVDRYINFFKQERANTPELQALLDEAKQAILAMQVMPSMRALMTAGEALKRENIAGFNCSYIAINNKRAFAEALYILMCGTGVGFSCERQEVAKLPVVPEVLQPSDDVIVVGDSKEGWAKAYAKLLSALYTGDIPQIDYSKLRPQGARLKTFGGRASGSKPLQKLFEFTINKFKHSLGKKLTSIDVHDIMCMVGEIVVVGGVRRSALISLSNLSDHRMRDAKSGQWWQDNPQRGLSNNSVAYTEKPSAEIFMEEWLALVKSKSGERGIFNRVAAQNQAAKYGRRNPNHSYGTNPCLTGDTLLLTSFGLRPLHELATYETAPVILNAEGKWCESSVVMTGVKPVVKVILSNGLEFKATKDHLIEIMVKKYEYSTDFIKPETIEVGNLNVGTKIRPLVLNAEWDGYEVFPSVSMAIFAGLMFGDGYKDHNRLAITNNEAEVQLFVNSLFPETVWNSKGKARLPQGIQEDLESRGIIFNPLPSRELPKDFFGWSSLTTKAFLKGLYSANGSFLINHSRITLKSTCLKLIKDIQLVLNALGYSPYITTNKPSVISWPNGEYESKQSYDLNISGASDCTRFQQEIGFLHNHKMQSTSEVSRNKNTRVVSVMSIEDLPPEPVYDFVEPNTSWAWVNGLKIHNCSEIILRDKQFCNLTEVIVRVDDDINTLSEKVRIATILGTFQASLTKFNFLSETWTKNTEEEALLGVSMTGIMDNLITSGQYHTGYLEQMLEHLRSIAVEVNKQVAELLGIKPSAAITCVKPSGTVSQLCDTASGIHARHNSHYIRTVRIDKKDPVYALLKHQGIPIEDDVMRPDSTAVVSFPQVAPQGCVTRNDMTALEQLELWLIYQRNWCEHKPSVTITVKEDEWVSVGAWVYEHFDEVSGISFLPHSDHTYQQAPYQDMTEESLNQWIKDNPSPVIDWSMLPMFEKEDETVSSQTLACVSGHCEI